jgi:hypothetical protein
MTDTATIAILGQIKNAARNKYSWPGGYPLFLLMGDGEAVCPGCAKREFRSICRHTIQPAYGRDWQCVAVDVNWEDGDMRCAHCYATIESAYGEREESAS